ncbi:MAG: ankyrin repeat domain-containing protein [Verrucomicrobiota bacterium]|nr:ankyrin repeat domain-containing protein [Verrucomicrobiota bacterium]
MSDRFFKFSTWLLLSLVCFSCYSLTKLYLSSPQWAARSLNKKGINALTVQKFHQLLQSKKFDTAQLFLNTKFPLDKPLDKQGLTPLMSLASEGNIDAVKWLIKNGANPKLSSARGDSAYSLAYENGHTNTMQFLVSTGCDTNVSLMSHVKAGNTHEILSQLDEHKNPSTLKDPDGTPLLLWAIKRKNITVMNYLIKKGSDVNLPEPNEGHTPLITACAIGHPEAVLSLINSGAILELEDKSGRTPLLWSIINDHREITNLLLKHGASVNTATGNQRFTPMHAAAINNRASAIELLTQHKAEIDPVDINGRTPLAWAAFKGSSNAVTTLLKYGANTEIQEYQAGLTPIEAAKFASHREIAHQMLGLKEDADAIPNQKDISQNRFKANRFFLSPESH